VEENKGPLNLTEDNLARPELIENVPFIRLEKLFDDSVFDLSKLLQKRYF
jgi:hypothetical protein